MESSDQPEFSCAICYEDFNSVEQKLQMPCCGKQESTVQFCRRCIEIISERGIQGRIGRCPGCSTYFSFLNGEVVPASEHNEQCQLCRQMKSIADLGRMLCDQCLLGSSFCFRYECSRCHGLQRIPHPMWKYQVDAISFGTNSWACHLGCHDYTMWRVISEDAVQASINFHKFLTISRLVFYLTRLSTDPT